MNKLNGLIIESEVYIAKISDNPANRCEQCECSWCDGEKLGDALCKAVLCSNEYLILSQSLTHKIKDCNE
ncbi:hypothetical protein [Duncaniella muris]|uniref:hypothetical protein n=1 Tax=Duncaniella muris TaxID=2094150 RepID=UPI0010571D67|nr:hypothetical protein [Duncaniella muris]